MITLIVFAVVILLGLTGFIIARRHITILRNLIDEGCNKMGDDIAEDLAPLKMLGLID